MRAVTTTGRPLFTTTITSTTMTASRLRALTAGQVLSCSPVVLEDEHGRRFEVVDHTVICPRTTDDQGRERPDGAPVLTLVVREVGTTG